MKRRNEKRTKKVRTRFSDAHFLKLCGAILLRNSLKTLED